MKEQQRLFISYFTVERADQVIRIAVRKEKIEIAIVIVVEEFQAPAAHQSRSLGNTGGNGDIVKAVIAVVAIDGEVFPINVGDEKILPAVVVKVSRIRSHSRAWTSIRAECHTGFGSNLGKSSFSTI